MEDKLERMTELFTELDETDRDRVIARAEILLEDPKYFKRNLKLIINTDTPPRQGRLLPKGEVLKGRRQHSPDKFF